MKQEKIGFSNIFSRIWPEVVVALMSLGFTLAVWQAMILHDHEHIHEVTRLAATSVQAHIVADIHSDILSEVLLTKLWAEEREPTAKEWELTAKLYRDHHPGCVAIAWLDSSLAVRRVFPAEGVEVLQAMNATGNGPARLDLETASRTKDLMVARFAQLPNGERVSWVGGAIFRGDEPRGYVFAFFRTQELLDDVLSDISSLGHHMAVFENGVEIYRSPGASRRDEREWGQDAEAKLPGVTWQVRVWPRPESLIAFRTHLPEWTLASGGALSILIVLVRHFAKMARLQSKRVRVSEACLAAILDSSADAVVSIDEQQRIVQFNQGAEKIFGHRREEALDQPVNMLIPERFRESHVRFVEQFAKGSHAVVRSSERKPLWGLRKDGTEFPAEAALSKLELEGRNIYTAILSDISERMRVAEELSRGREELELRVQERTTELQKANEVLQEVSGNLLRSQDEERRRLARDLHDSVTQDVVFLGMQLSTIRNSVPESSRPALDDCIHLADQCCTEIRTISHLLHPPMLEAIGLGPSLAWYVDGFVKRSGIRVSLDVQPELGRLPNEVELALFRIVQEVLTNIRRHAQSGTARIDIRRDGAQVRLEAADEGTGIPRDVLEPRGDRAIPLGVGIAGMRERARQLGGHLSIQSSARGTTVSVALPVLETGVPAVDRALAGSEGGSHHGNSARKS